ncbi:RNA-directed DNA polymerase, eukaryota [Tanacetum coccineum]
MRSVLVNRIPTSEFQFHKGLKQGDPLSPFLFILIMESLHLSFSKVTNAGLFLGIPIDSLLTLSHLFFTDDAIFIGKWDSLNIRTIVNVLKCFHLASGLKINFHKSKLMGIGTHPEEVDAAATTMSCSIFTTFFVHLGVKVASSCNRLEETFLMEWTGRKEKWLGLVGIRFIKAIYGEDDALNSPSSLSKRSPWLDIIREVTVLCTKGINLLKFNSQKVVEKINHAFMVDTFRRPSRGGAEEEQLGFLLSRMDGIILTNISDRWVWSLKATGEFFVKFVRQLIDDSILPKEEVAIRWVKVMPIKINVFAWRLRLNKLPTRLNLSL